MASDEEPEPEVADGKVNQDEMLHLQEEFQMYMRNTGKTVTDLLKDFTPERTYKEVTNQR